MKAVFERETKYCMVIDARQPNTNCLTYIPNDIKLELNNGTLTLKAGSKIYVPNGKDSNGNNVFEEVIISADRVFNYGYNDSRLLFTNVAGDYFYGFPVSVCYSGATAPTGNQWMYWYDTTNNIIKNTSDSGATWVQGYSLPLCKITMNSNNVISIDQVFNGFGYIGSILFGLPNVKGLIPNGKNADGSNNCIDFEWSNVTTYNVTVSTGGNGIRAWSTYIAQGGLHYNPNTNYNYTNSDYTETRQCAVVGTYVTDSNGKITSLNINSVQPETIPYYKALKSWEKGQYYGN